MHNDYAFTITTDIPILLVLKYYQCEVIFLSVVLVVGGGVVAVVQIAKWG